jgi:hypothetical protein
VAATTGHKAITADQLKGALLTKVGGASPATAPESGNYGRCRTCRPASRPCTASRSSRPGAPMPR